MAKIAFENLSCKIEVSDIEIRREGKSFTAETISYFVSQGYDNIFFLCGTDMFLTLDEWYKPEYIFEHSTIVCARRKNDNTFEKNIFEKKKQYEQQYNAKIEILNVNIIDVSSSEIREDIAKNKTSKFLTNDVLSYIKNNNLYR